ncbi:helix-turn-helix transcriptional regulator [Plantactinospora sp. B5E13]|uniref:helix-turn-helix domain-containing protein n=1 Tax=unclassified Plantactinospora TaxID=2631981 RepID=UPI00325E5A8F
MNDLREILRRHRIARRLTQAKLGKAIKVSGSLIAAIEQGRIIPQPDTALRLDEFFGTEDEIQQAAVEARKDARPPWLRPWTEHEERATLLRWWEPLLLPGLLQTEDYTRNLLRGGWLSDEVIDRTVDVRRDRRAVTVDRPQPPRISAIIGEFALTCGEPEVRREQLKHLLDLSQRPTVQVLVVPTSAGLHAGLQGAFVLATLPAGRRAGYVDDQLQGRVVTDSGDLDQLEVSWEIVSGLALPVHASRDLIQKAINDHD